MLSILIPFTAIVLTMFRPIILLTVLLVIITNMIKISASAYRKLLNIDQEFVFLAMLAVTFA